MSTAAYVPPVDRPPPLPPASNYGGFWVRFAAHLVDGFLVGLIALLVSLAMALAAELGPAVLEALPFAIIVVGQIYHAWFVSSKQMATPGKRLCALYVTSLDGRRISFGRALWRNVASFFSYLTLYVGFFMAGFTERKQALHDKLAGTVVHRQPGRSSTAAIVIIVALCVVVPIGGIVAAVAIPAYQDFTVRSRIALVHGAMMSLKEPIEKYALEKGAWPDSWEQLGVADPTGKMSASAREVLQEMRLGRQGEVIAAVRVMGRDGEIRLTPRRAGDAVQWDCSSSERVRKYVIASCRK